MNSPSRRWYDIQKCNKVLKSCETLDHYIVCHRMIDQFGKKYDFDYVWSGLDKKCSMIIDMLFDAERFKKRKETLDI